MKQVNFKELNVEYGVDKFQKADLTHEIGDAMKIICTSFKIIIAKAVEAGTTEVETKDKEE